MSDITRLLEENERLRTDLAECRRLLRRALECMDYGQVMTRKDSEAAREAAGGDDE